MSTQYISGLETFDDGDTQARNKINADMSRLNEFARENLPFHFLGEAQANVVFWWMEFTSNVYLTAITFNSHFGPPYGQNLILQAKVNGVTQPQNYILPAGATSAQVFTANETDILIPAGQPLELFFSQVGSSGTKGQDIKGFVMVRKVQL